MKLRFFVLITGLFCISNQELVSKAEGCFLRCVAQCVAFVEKSDSTQQSLDACKPQCQKLNNKNLCSDNTCWSTCNGELVPEKTLPAPTNLTLKGVRGLSWSPVPGAVMYYIGYRTLNSKTFTSDDFVITEKQTVDLSTLTNIDPCSELEVAVAAFSEDGIGNESKELKISSPKPTANPKLDLLELQYLNTTLVSDFYQANATVHVEFRYKTDPWFLGPDDLDVQPLFHLISCVDPDLSQGIPVPDFDVHVKNSTISTSIGSDMMDRKCRYVYYLQSVMSKKCNTMTEMPSPPSSALQTIQVECDIVKNAPCVKVPSYQPPLCGMVENVAFSVLSRDRENLNDPASNLTVNVTFIPVTRNNEMPTLYYIGIFGTASEYHTKEEETFLGVNITHVIGKESSCTGFDSSGNCLAENLNRSIVLQGIHPKTLYGLTICAVKDIRNLTLPDVTLDSKSFRAKADRIMLVAHTSNNPVGMIIGIVIGSLVVILVAIVVIWFYFRKKSENMKFKFQMEQVGKNNMNRYIDFPIMAAKNDIWEIERRNLIIHNDKKLGSGAFGAVYLGKLIGKSLAHKDANSPLGINLMRAENCQVAVKMLPEYADEMSKHEFLREIALMKTLGYHERLVNMLACVTESEPLCLVVEYCDNGDLLKFLRERCKYMMKLDDLGINYHDPPENENYDTNMIVTLKQLLQFAVQISYGLEYLSQKGFVHRDVAARNVLVHEGTACKIGDFGLCRYIYADQSQYKSKGGKLPLKWMSPEAIRHYEFSIKSDIWSFGILLFEVITLGGSPYPGMPPEDVLPFLEGGGRIEKPDNCPENFYDVMMQCWNADPDDRIEFSDVRMQLATQLEDITEDYSYLKLDAAKDYYNVQYGDEKKTDVVIIPDEIIKPSKLIMDDISEKNLVIEQ
ncbi:receptor protein-tyrosine kinase [Caenorhabditis elegans]|uniref:receptor protein-tyrosine kinase n=1 Tax=Caenorhabditis elegans TaxID=6239 RepID=O76385_CAEEL|nr:receptor protein-tyrosine kinase [Caenorhabditis elegans]CCD65129.1 receptor protein-tyrosine kinase [Caenorhabditis elegans]|eukprot:NP_504458.1 Hypoxia Inhibited Receptor tyrosine kinase [Caenorhabditis elegans]